MLATLMLLHAVASGLGPCDEAGAPSFAVVAGRITSKKGAALAGVHAEAIVAGDGRRVTAVSDPDGRYALAGLDVGADIELTYRQDGGRVEAGCWVRLTSRAPRSIDVVLDDFRPDEVSTSAGCQDVSPNDSWVTVGELRQLVVAGLDDLHPAPLTKEPVPRLELRSSDIALVAPGAGDDLIVRFAPAAQRSLAEFTGANAGRVVVITIDGVVAQARATVHGAITSGVSSIARPALRGRLCDILRSAPQRQDLPSPAR